MCVGQISEEIVQYFETTTDYLSRLNFVKNKLKTIIETGNRVKESNGNDKQDATGNITKVDIKVDNRTV